jgi:hypothetical protein
MYFCIELVSLCIKYSLILKLQKAVERHKQRKGKKEVETENAELQDFVANDIVADVVLY